MRNPLIAANWKMHTTRAEARGLAEAAAATARDTDREVLLIPPAPWLGLVLDAVGGPDGRVAVGAQACHPEPQGAFTGAVAAGMLAELGCRYVLCGHSERRQPLEAGGFGESDVFVAASLRAALDAGLTPILCVGETAQERADGQTQDVLARQLDAGLAPVTPGEPLVVAYEPVWAIGSGQAATPTEAAEAHAFLRTRVAAQDADRAAGLRILYGGSVKPANAAGFLGEADVDGALVGGASLQAESFAGIVHA